MSTLVLARRKQAIPFGRLREGWSGEQSRARESQYIVAKPFTARYWVSRKEDPITITVPEGMLTDLTSVPPPLRGFVNRVGPHLEAAILHDYLFVAWIILDREPLPRYFHFANDLMRIALNRAGGPRWQQAAINFAVRTYIGWRVFVERDDPSTLFVHDPMRGVTDQTGLMSGG
ncbi:MAG: DUF1353 domain-containing protein [Pseudomonadota bacterium]